MELSLFESVHNKIMVNGPDQNRAANQQTRSSWFMVRLFKSSKPAIGIMSGSKEGRSLSSNILAYDYPDANLSKL